MPLPIEGKTPEAEASTARASAPRGADALFLDT
jgi:hypothetical protein